MSFLSYLVTYVCIVLAVAFFTLLERKGLSYIQARKGPNKVGLMGLPQPLADAAKLLMKEMLAPKMATLLPFFSAPIISFTLSLFLWQLYPSTSSICYFEWGVLFFLCVSSLSVYGTLLAGWASNSKYALLGGIRAIAQTISYEVSMALIMFFPLFLAGSFNFMSIMEYQNWVWFSLVMPPVMMLWFMTCIAETHRAPFDFAEGESELVSGFNIEFGGAAFALIFLAEYANILVMSLLTAVLFFGGKGNDFILIVETLFFAFGFIWVRASYPRYRYDLLMNLTWKGFLPVALALILVLTMCLLFFRDWLKW